MRKVKILVMVLSIVMGCNSSLLAQIAINKYKALGGSKDDNNPSMVRTNDGGFLIGFVSESKDIDCVGNYGKTDVVLIKLDANGEKQWSKCYGGSNYDDFGGLVARKDGAFYVVGSTSSRNGDLPASNKGKTDRWIFKVDSEGKVLWSKVYGGSLTDYGIWIDQKSNGNLIAGGQSFSDDLDVGKNYGYFDSWITELTSDGELLHSVVTGTSNDERDLCGRVTSDDGFVACVRVIDAYDTVFGPAPGDYDVLVLKGNSQMEVEWTSLRGGYNFDGNVGDIIELPDGYLFVGDTWSTNHDLQNAGCLEGANMEQDVWVCKLNSLGALKWSRCLGSAEPSGMLSQRTQSANHGRSLFATEDGGYMVFSVSFKDYCSSYYYDYGYTVRVTKLDSLGYIMWQQNLGEFTASVIGDIVYLGSGRWAMAIENWSVSENCEPAGTGFGGYDVWFVDMRECQYYQTSKPEGDERVCVNLTPTTQYLTHPYWAADKYSWTVTPPEAGTVKGNDSIVNIEWSSSFNGEAKIAVHLATECGASKTSDTLSVMIYSDCTSVEDLKEEIVTVYFQPNPTHATANLKYTLPSGLTHAAVTLVDLTGRVVYRGELNDASGSLLIDVSALSSGIYQCIVNAENTRGNCRLLVR